MSTSGSRGTAIDKISLWIVEDEPLFREATTEVINLSDSIQCERAFSTCEDALRTLRSEFAPVAMLMDIMLPGGMDGIACVEAIKQVSPATEIIMLTGVEEDDQVFRAICAGASGYLLKGATPDEIIQAVKDVVAGGRPMNAQIAKKVLDKFAELARPRGEVYNLTGREREILSMLIDGAAKRDIAQKMYLSRFTVETHIKNIYTKLQVHSLGELFSKLFPHPLI